MTKKNLLHEIVEAENLKPGDKIVFINQIRTVQDAGGWSNCAGSLNYGYYGYLKLYRTEWAKGDILEMTKKSWARSLGEKLKILKDNYNPTTDDPDIEWVWTFQRVPYIKVTEE